MTTPRPATILLGVVCLGVALVIGVAILQFAWGQPRIALACLVIVGSLTAWALRSGWPRWVVAIMAISSTTLTWDLVSFQFTFRILLPVATGLQLALEVIGIVLLFHPNSTRWYRRHRSTNG